MEENFLTTNNFWDLIQVKKVKIKEVVKFLLKKTNKVTSCGVLKSNSIETGSLDDRRSYVENVGILRISCTLGNADT